MCWGKLVRKLNKYWDFIIRVVITIAVIHTDEKYLL